MCGCVLGIPCFVSKLFLLVIWPMKLANGTFYAMKAKTNMITSNRCIPYSQILLKWVITCNILFILSSSNAVWVGDESVTVELRVSHSWVSIGGALGDIETSLVLLTKRYLTWLGLKQRQDGFCIWSTIMYQMSLAATQTPGTFEAVSRHGYEIHHLSSLFLAVPQFVFAK